MMSPPDPEVPEKKARRKFTAKYKLQILQEADACTEPGQLGTFLRSKSRMGDVLHIVIFCLRSWFEYDSCLTCQDSHD